MALSDLFSPSLMGIAQRLGLEPTHKDRPAWSYSTKYKAGVDARLTGILSTAAERFAQEHPGYTVEATSGKNPRASGTRWHPGGIATDVQITDPTGKKLGNYRDAKSFRTYEQFAQTARAVQKETYPELDDHFAWGGYYGGRFAADQMHFDLGPTRGSLGSWETGLNKAGRNFLPGAESVGIGRSQVAGVPTPTARPDPFDPANMDPDPTFGSLGPMFGARQHPDFAAPLGQVERAPLSSFPSLTSEHVGSLGVPPSGSYGALQPEHLSPVSDFEHIVGREVPGVSNASALGTLAGAMVGPPSPMRPDNLNYAGPKGLFNVSPNLLSPDMMAPALSSPTSITNRPVADFIAPIPGAPPASTIAPTPPEVANVTAPTSFPAAPAPPSKWDNFKYSAKPVVKDALLGAKFGLPGMLGGAAIGLMGDNIPGFSDIVGPGFDRAAPDRFSTGFGLHGITDAMAGPKGAEGFSLSNPGSSFTSLGPGMGGLRRSDKFGWTEHVDPSGSVVGISYDNPDEKGLLGQISKSMNSKFGGSGKNATKAERASFAGKAGLW